MQIQVADGAVATTLHDFYIITSGSAIYESARYTSEDWQNIPFFIGTTFTKETELTFSGATEYAGGANVTTSIQILGYQTQRKSA